MITRKLSAPGRLRSLSGDSNNGSTTRKPSSGPTSPHQQSSARHLASVNSDPCFLTPSKSSSSSAGLSLPLSVAPPSQALRRVNEVENGATAAASPASSPSSRNVSGGRRAGRKSGAHHSVFNLAQSIGGAAERVDENFLTCSVCRERYKEPKVSTARSSLA